MEIDFITAFGRLLRDGLLREVFAANPKTAATSIRLRRADLKAWQQLVPADLEFQATELLRKRLDLVKYFAPETCRLIGENLWPAFQRYGRTNWPTENLPKSADALEFCRHLREEAAKPVAASEWHRLSFANSRHRIRLHWTQFPTKGGKSKHGFQLFLRGPGKRWREFLFYLSL